MTRPRVLLVEDEPEAARGMKRLLSLYQIDCDLAATAEEALCRLPGTVYGVIVTDLRLPGESGQTLCERLRASHLPGGTPASAPMVLCSGDPAGVVRASGFDVVLKKPCPASVLVRVIRSLLPAGAPGPAEAPR